MIQRHKKFIQQLGICLILVIAMIQFLNTSPLFKPHQPLYWFSLFVFVLISVMAYLFGIRTFNSQNKYDFSNLFIIITISKLLIFLITFVLYQILAEPQNKLFILPFFAIYLIFTIFEVYLLSKIGKRGEL